MMSELTKIRDDEGTYSVHGAGGIIRGGLTRDEADDVMAMLRSMEPDED